MGNHNRRGWLVVCVLLAGVVGLGSIARADYESEQNDQHLGVIERALDKYKKDPAIFDGKVITAGASVTAVKNHASACNNAIQQFNTYYNRVSAKGKATDRAKAVVARIRELDPWCKALVTAGNAYIGAIRDQQQAAANAKAAMKSKCDKARVAALQTLGGNDLHVVLDTWAGARTPTTAEHVTTFRGKFEKLVTMCKQPDLQGVVEGCKGEGLLLSSETNKRYDYGDICAPAVDPEKTMQAVAMRLVEIMANAGQSKPPTVDSFRRDDGWIHDTNPIAYKTYFQVTDKTKQDLLEHAKAAFAAAGVAVPGDLSMLWARKQEYLDALKAAVDSTAGEWTLSESACKGYACGLAKKSILKAYKGAKIKAVYGRDWRISKNALGIPEERYQSIKVVFQVKGEPYCQVRSVTAHEDYKGHGKYQKAKGTGWGYGRFQTACK